MGLSLIAIAIVLVTTYIWLTRGFFSAFLHMMCVVLAGGIAFAFWEPLAYAFLGKSSFLEAIAWCMGLALPFVASLVVLRLVCDKVIRYNLAVPKVADYVGGGLCGLVAGVVVAGITVISLGTLRLDTVLLGHRALSYSSNGSIVRSGGLWVPVDRVVTKFYGQLSAASFRTSTPLASEYPNLDEVGTSLRMNFGDGKGRTTVKPKDFEMVARFTVGKGKNLPTGDLLNDAWMKVPQKYTDADKANPIPGSHLEGFVVKFNAGANEKGEGKKVIGASQIRLVIMNAAVVEEADEFQTLYPIAATCQADSTSPQMARFRYDANDTYLASPGGASEATFGFEFVVPPGFEPLSLYVKNVRHIVADDKTAKPWKEFGSASERDAAIKAGALIKPQGVAGPAGTADSTGAVPAELPVDVTQEVKAGSGQPLQPNVVPQIEGVRFNNRLPWIIQKGTHGGLEIDDKNTILNGLATFAADYKSGSFEKTLKIERLLTTTDTVIVQIDVTLGTKFSFLGQAAAGVDKISPPLLRDTGGQVYEPVGYIYEDQTRKVVRYTPGEPIRSLSQLASQDGISLTRSRTDQKLTLIFRVSLGVTLDRFTLGNKSIVKFDPPVPLDMQNK